LINNRQAGRRRGRGGQQQRSSGGGNPGRQDTGNRIDNRARGNAAQLLEKYKTLARDAQMQGDRVNVEYYLQFADHYFRVLAETRARFEENGGAVSTKRIQGATLDEDEPDYEDEAPEQPPRQQEQPRQNGQQNGYRQEGRHDGNRQDGNRQDGRNSNQNDQQRGQGGNQNAGQPNGNADQRPDYEDRPRRANGNDGFERGVEGPRDERQPRGDRYERQDRVARPPQQPQGEQPPVERTLEQAPETSTPVEATEAPRRGRGRPRRDAAPVEAVADDAGFDGGFALPPSLTLSAVVAEPANDLDTGEEAAEKPRRRRGRPPASEAGTLG
jgi:hypothetical protein